MRRSFKELPTRCSQLFRPILVNNEKSKSSMIKRTFLTAAIVGSISIGSVYADDHQEKEFETVYHVYMNGERMGVVSDKAVVESVVKERIKEAEAHNTGYSFTRGANITYVPEQMFQPIFNNTTVANKINDQFYVMAEAATISIDNGKARVYVKNQEDALQVLKTLKLEYVPKYALTTTQNVSSKEPKVEVGSSKILDVHLAENVTINEGKVFLKDILTVQEAVEYLQKGTLEPKKHTVVEGEVLGEIAQKYDLSLDDLYAINPGLTEDSLLHIGDELVVMAYKPLVHVVMEKVIHRKEVIPFEKEIIEDDSIFKGITKVKQEGKRGKQTVLYKLTKENGVLVDKQVLEYNVLKEPVNEIIIKGTKEIPSRGTGEISWPTNGGYISSPMGYRWGRLHKGIDIARPNNRTIAAADNGVVEFAGWDGDYGNKVVIDHNNGMKTVYAHMKSISVSEGDTVPKGSKLGIMGSTGRSTGVHLHFEVYKDGELINPKKFY